MTVMNATRMTDEVFRIMRDRIVQGELPAGTRLDTTTLSADLGVSRTPVREAMLRLEAAGLVAHQPYRGTVVTGVDASRLEEVTALRIDLEGRAALLGVPRLSTDDIARMAATLDELDACRDAADFSFGVFNELNGRFHGLLYAAADAPVLSALITQLSAEADRIRLHFDVRAPLAEAYHREILMACRQRDAAAAALATRRHLLEAYVGMRGEPVIPPGILADVLAELHLEIAS